MKRFLFFSFISLLILFTACFTQIGPLVPLEHSLSYSVSNCYNQKPITDPLDYEKVLVDVRIFSSPEKITIKQKIEYNCCAELSVDYVVEGKKLNMYNKNKGTLCNCSCLYDLYADVSIQNISLFSLYGVGHAESQGILLHREEITQ